MKRLTFSKLLMIPLIMLPALASAHSFLIKAEPQQEQYLVRIMMTEKYFEGDRELEPGQLTLTYITTGGEQSLQVEQTEKAKELTLKTPVSGKTAVIAANLAPRYRGLEKGQPATTPEQTLRIDNFAKTLVQGSENTVADYVLASGQTLEIVPLQDPYVGEPDSIQLQVLFNGKPIEAKLRAGLATEKPQTYSTDEEGKVTITGLEAGVWLVRTKVEVLQQDEKSHHYEASASLLFTLR